MDFRSKIRKTKNKKLIIKDKNKQIINVDISVLSKKWKKAIWDKMG